MKQIKLSVIIPIYNVEKYLKSCLESVARQTMRDIEVIMVNDGSVDKSAEIARNFEEKYENFSLVNQSNLGAASARNRGLVNARGNYVAFLDADDLALPEAYEKLVNIAHSTNACQVRCSFAEFDHFLPEKVEIRSNFNRYIVIDRASEKFKFYLEKKIDGVVWNGIYKRSLFKDIRFPEGVDYEDHHIIPRLLGETEMLIYLPEPLICYRKRPASVTTSANPEFEADKVKSVNELSEVLKQYGFYEELLPLFSVYLYTFVLHYHQKLIGRYPLRLRQGHFSAADLLNEQIIYDVIDRGNLDEESRIRLITLLKSHFIFFFNQKKGAVIEELLQGKKTSVDLSKNDKSDFDAEHNVLIVEYIRSFN